MEFAILVFFRMLPSVAAIAVWWGWPVFSGAFAV